MQKAKVSSSELQQLQRLNWINIGDNQYCGYSHMRILVLIPKFAILKVKNSQPIAFNICKFASSPWFDRLEEKFVLIHINYVIKLRNKKLNTFPACLCSTWNESFVFLWEFRLNGAFFLVRHLLSTSLFLSPSLVKTVRKISCIVALQTF